MSLAHPLICYTVKMVIVKGVTRMSHVKYAKSKNKKSSSSAFVPREYTLTEVFIKSEKGC